MSGPLSINLDITKAKTQVPLFAENQYIEFRLTELSQAEVPQKGNVLKFKWQLVNPAAGADGPPINPGDFGSTFFEQVQLYAKPDAKDPEWFLKRIAARIDGLLGTGDEGNAKGKPPRPALSADLVPTLIGKTVFFKMKVKTGEFAGNEVADIRHPSEMPSA
jgi:hypothetical protein